MMRPFISLTYGGKTSVASPIEAMMIVPPGASAARRASRPVQAVTTRAPARKRAEVRMRGGGWGDGRQPGNGGKRRGTNDRGNAMSSSVPGPRIVRVVDDESCGLGTELVIGIQWLRAGIFELSYRGRQCRVKIVGGRRAPQR